MSIHFPYLNLENCISGMDFNPAGELVATIDLYGVCLISDINTNKYGFHTVMNMSSEFGGNNMNL